MIKKYIGTDDQIVETTTGMPPPVGVWHPVDPANDAQEQIDKLEKRQLRAIREHLMGDTTAMGRIQVIDSEISTLRAQLV